jgi:Uma2 family endonuclease
MSALPQPPFQPVAVTDYLAHEPHARHRNEYLSGRVFAMAGASPNHNQVVVNITAALATLLRDRDCTNYANEQRVVVQAGAAYLYPDIVVTCGNADFVSPDPPSLVNPLIIMEVLSPSTEARDRGEKFLQYQTISSLREYILVSQWPRRFESFLKQDDGTWAYRAYSVGQPFLEVVSLASSISAEDVYRKVRAESA